MNLTETCQALVFKIADRHWALPQTAIVRVTSAAAIEINPSSQGQLVLLNNIPLTLLPLDRLLSTALTNEHGNSSPSAANPFLVVTRHARNPVAIAVKEPPLLIDLHLNQVQMIPPLHRSQIHNIAQYMALVDHLDQTLSIFLLDLKQAMKLG